MQQAFKTMNVLSKAGPSLISKARINEMFCTALYDISCYNDLCIFIHLHNKLCDTGGKIVITSFLT